MLHPRLIRDEDLPFDERVALERPAKKPKSEQDAPALAAALGRTRGILGGSASRDAGWVGGAGRGLRVGRAGG